MGRIKTMKSLSIAQPWVECILKKGKNVENRSWNTKRRGYFAIHASASVSKERFEYCLEDYGCKFDPKKLSYGSIVGFVELKDVIKKKDLTRATKKWFSGEFGFVLGRPIRLKRPVKTKGALLFWNLKGSKLKQVMRQLTLAQRKRISKRLL